MPPITTRTLSTNGVDLHITEAGDPSAYPVIFAHGFPELSYSWRHQLPAMADAGYHAVAPDGRGYGRSSRPEAVEDYDITKLTGDLIGVLDDLGKEQAVFVGHDWGAIVVWNLAVLAPERVAAVVGMSVPFIPRATAPPTERMRAIFGDNFFYMLYFQEPGVADANLGRDVATTMRRFMAGSTVRGGSEDLASMFAPDDRGLVERMAEPEGLPDWLSQEELDHYVAEFSRTGFTGGINWYRNFDRNWKLTEHIADTKVEMPSFFIAGAQDPVLIMSPPAGMDGWLNDHRGNVILEGAGHWVQQEKATEVNGALLGFLADVTP